MARIAKFLTSSIGRKMLMAATGLLLLVFLVFHLEGNLLLYAGPEVFNEHSHELISNPLVYVAELGLIVLFVAHFVSGILVYRGSAAARPEPYQHKRWAGHTSHRTWASTTMILSGLVVLVFVPVHLWTFKFGRYYASAAHPEMRDLYKLVIEEFHKPGYVVWYVFAMVVIGFHLWHGFGSAFESLGVHYRKTLRRFGEALAVLVAAGFLSIPIAVYFLGTGR
jgi:succinate dehydrogenase / fumarate reductase cytochrome b subunit